MNVRKDTEFRHWYTRSSGLCAGQDADRSMAVADTRCRSLVDRVRCTHALCGVLFLRPGPRRAGRRTYALKPPSRAVARDLASWADPRTRSERMNDTSPAEIDDVLTGRTLIDGVDEEILRLVERRRVLSRRVQELRRRDGALGVQHARENEIIARYATALGRPGAELALLLLGVCKRTGDIPRQVPA